MSDHPHSKKEKKKLIRLRNLKNRLLFLHIERIQAGAKSLGVEYELEREESEEERKKREEEVVWSAKVQDIRNRLTDRKRQAQDRWNRFAGTEGSGGMGR